MRVWYVGGGAYLVACLLIGNVLGQYHALWPLCQRRGICGPSYMLGPALQQFDVAYASVGLLVGVTSLAVVGWVRRGK